MKEVQKAVEDRGNEDAHGNHHDQPAVEGITAGEELAGPGVQFAHRPHAAQDHGGIDEGIQPGHALKLPIAQDADEQGDRRQTEGHRPIFNQALDEQAAWE